MEVNAHSGRYRIIKTDDYLKISFPPRRNKILIYLILPVFLVPIILFWFTIMIQLFTISQEGTTIDVFIGILALVLILLIPGFIIAQQFLEKETLTLTVKSLTYKSGYLWFTKEQNYLCTEIRNLRVHEEKYQYEYHFLRSKNTMKNVSDFVETTSGGIEFFVGLYPVTLFPKLNHYEAQKIIDELKTWYGTVGNHSL